MKVLEILDRARACCTGLPARKIRSNTLRDYRSTFSRMWREPKIDALRPGIARDTYNHRRASLHVASYIMLSDLSATCMAAGDRNDQAAIQLWAAVLLRALQRIEPALALDPPAPPGVLPWKLPPSRWHQMEGPKPKRGRNSKKHVLGKLPKDWQERLWQAAERDWPHRMALAIHLMAPVRPEELIPGNRPSGWSPGVELVCLSPERLAITYAPVKSHDGIYGTERTTITVDPTKAGEVAAFLASQCAAVGGRMVVSISSKNAVRKAVGVLGQRALPQCRILITPYVLRHKVLADLKATFGGGEQVAAAAGQCTDRTQSAYAGAQLGSKLEGYIAVTSERVPRTGNVERARKLGTKKRAASPNDKPKDSDV